MVLVQSLLLRYMEHNSLIYININSTLMKRSYLAKLICLFLLCTIKSSSYAQIEKLRFEHYSLKNGLRFTNVTNLLQDRKGYLWFGTYDGLNKYDGYNFVTYKHT